MAIAILLYEVKGKRKTKIDVPISKNETKNEKWNWKFEFRFPMSQENGWRKGTRIRKDGRSVMMILVSYVKQEVVSPKQRLERRN